MDSGLFGCFYNLFGIGNVSINRIIRPILECMNLSIPNDQMGYVMDSVNQHALHQTISNYQNGRI